MANLLETLMILCFGLSWPISIRKSYRSRTAKGKSLFFEFFIWTGYIFGIIRKGILFYADGTKPDFLFYLGWFFYFFNMAAITIDMGLYFRNSRLDRQTQEKQ